MIFIVLDFAKVLTKPFEMKKIPIFGLKEI
ncbi:hypothetical protein HMPREF9700_00430 [Bergeyella zoohelcum CCUG 30536]|uniref:Uncharacterized protein n=1 Tax=Bergeyella zoohelcum TaxID=1015 RepID=A0A376BZS6_9FLAO|nr:hypothetical protein HMPREF9700_00430 [Bergeyella zoohelcum CCUG 30536]SSZ46974.1 Uncharacterised protein [Bergeyella zoohelcum]